AAQKPLLHVILVIAAMWFMLFLAYPNLVMTRLYANGRLENKSASERMASLKNSWPIIKEHWLGGVGMGNYTLALRHELKQNEQSYYYQPIHNVWLLVLAETGVLGLAVFLGILVYLIIFNFKFLISEKMPNAQYPMSKLFLGVGKSGDGTSALINLANLAVIIVIMCFDHWLWSLHFGVLFFWLILGLAKVYSKA
ncbi:MAG: O-antigen ligase family protein, partial [Patescibacteria group bacterium]|nr:O-antigen ligase family protein [Patescibacteria group bacterium]